VKGGRRAPKVKTQNEMFREGGPDAEEMEGVTCRRDLYKEWGGQETGNCAQKKQRRKENEGGGGCRRRAGRRP